MYQCINLIKSRNFNSSRTSDCEPSDEFVTEGQCSSGLLPSRKPPTKSIPPHANVLSKEQRRHASSERGRQPEVSKGHRHGSHVCGANGIRRKLCIASTAVPGRKAQAKTKSSSREPQNMQCETINFKRVGR